MSLWDSPPPLAAISGKEGFLRRREARNARLAAEKAGRCVVEIPGDDGVAIEEAITSPPMFATENTTVFIEQPEKVNNPHLLMAHHRAGEDEISVVLLFDGEVPAKMAKALSDLPDGVHVKFPSPKPWEVESHAVKFCQAEAKRNRCTMTQKAAVPVVGAVGTDYGVLSFEVLKAATLVRSEGRKEITRADFAKVVAVVFQHEAFPIVRFLGGRDGANVLRSLGLLKRTTREDPTMRVCGLVGSQITVWIQAIGLLKTGYSPDEAAARLGRHPYAFKKDLLPITKRWSVPLLTKLLRGIASVERSVKGGHANPWVDLNALLYRSCVG